MSLKSHYKELGTQFQNMYNVLPDDGARFRMLKWIVSYLDPFSKLTKSFETFIDENGWILGGALPSQYQFSLVVNQKTLSTLIEDKKLMSTTEVATQNLEVMGALSIELGALAEELIENGEATVKIDGNTLLVVRSKKKATKETEDDDPKKKRRKKGKEDDPPKKKRKKKAETKEFEFGDPDDSEEFDKVIADVDPEEAVDAVEAWAKTNEIEYVKADKDKITIKRIRKSACDCLAEFDKDEE